MLDLYRESLRMESLGFIPMTDAIIVHGHFRLSLGLTEDLTDAVILADSSSRMWMRGKGKGEPDSPQKRTSDPRYAILS